MSKSDNLIGLIVFDAARQTKKTNPSVKKNDAFTRAFSCRGAHSHWRPLFSQEGVTSANIAREIRPVCTGLNQTTGGM